MEIELNWLSWLVQAPLLAIAAWFVSETAHSIGRRRWHWFAFAFFLLPIAIIVLIPSAYRAGRREADLEAAGEAIPLVTPGHS